MKDRSRQQSASQAPPYGGVEVAASGERFVPGRDTADVHLEHLHRYWLAAELPGERVLDVGCGAGYGAVLLEHSGARVWAVDLALSAVGGARDRYREDTVRWRVADARRLPFPPASFDRVVCFEVMEQTADPEEVLDECRRVLAPGGVLIVSTPNRPQYTDARGFENPHHLRELDREELAAMLAERFAAVELYGQRLLAGSRVWHSEEGGGDPRELRWAEPCGDSTARLVPGGEPMYWLAVCSQAPAPPRLPAGSLLGGRLEALLEDLGEREAEIRGVYESVIDDLRRNLEAFDQRVRRLGLRIQELQGRLEAADRRTAEAERRAAASDRQAEDTRRRADAERQRADAEWQRAEEAAGRAAQLHAEVYRITRDLVTIHQSQMWTIWTGYHTVRKLMEKIPRFARRMLRAAYGRLRRFAWWGWSTLLRVLRLIRRLLMTGPRLLGRLYLTVWARRRRDAARRRRAAALQPDGERQALQPGESPPRQRPGQALARRPRVLLVSPYSIYPPNHGGGVRIYNLIQRIGREVDLHLMVFSRNGEEPEQRAALEPYCASVRFHRWDPKLEPDFFRLSSPAAQLFRSPELVRRLRQVTAAENIDILQLEYTELGQYAERVEAPKTILTEIDITFRSRARRRAAGLHRRYRHDRVFGSSAGDSLRQLRYELAVCAAADQVHVMSQTDGEYLASFLDDGGRRLRVVPNGVDTGALTPPAAGGERRGALFVGNFQHLPNLDAIDFLLADIWPRVRERVPGAELTVVGVAPPERVLDADGTDGVRAVGEVPEVMPYLRCHRVMIAPIRAGSGTRLKILEAMACGLPVVSTALGAEGIDVEPGRHLLVAEDAAGLAAETARLLADPTLAGELAEAARRRVVELYDWDASAERLLDAYWQMMPEPARTEVRERAAGLAAVPHADVSVPDVSVVLPTWNGGKTLERTLAAITDQRTARSVEVVCVDSGSSPADLAMMRRFGARIESIDQADFDHGLTRDLGARIARGRVLVFLNQDAIPADPGWLDRMTEPLLTPPADAEVDHAVAAVQGGIRELPDPGERFYWDSCGHRFYFTSESDRWLERYSGVGFSTVNAALRREVWERHPFGRAPIMEDKKWQREVVAAGWHIAVADDAYVLHTHDYDYRRLVRRCQSEGYGWKLLGERYAARDMLRDMLRPRVWADLLSGLVTGKVRSAAELLFPWLRPWSLYRGNRWGQGVKL